MTHMSTANSASVREEIDARGADMWRSYAAQKRGNVVSSRLRRSCRTSCFTLSGIECRSSGVKKLD